MGGDALEQALALLRAPAQRQALRSRPLPDDVGLVIQLASAPEPLLHATAARLGAPDAELLEAVRFYLEQVLFDDRADAYRNLGVARDAPLERIRQHYHWLQRWLHPDRQGEDWAGVYAIRVNQAWAKVRNPAARAAYDAAEAAAAAPEPEAAPLAEPAARWVPVWTPGTEQRAIRAAAPAPTRGAGRSRKWAAAIAGSACAVVALGIWLAVRPAGGPRGPRIAAAGHTASSATAASVATSGGAAASPTRSQAGTPPRKIADEVHARRVRAVSGPAAAHPAPVPAERIVEQRLVPAPVRAAPMPAADRPARPVRVAASKAIEAPTSARRLPRVVRDVPAHVAAAAKAVVMAAPVPPPETVSRGPRVASAAPEPGAVVSAPDARAVHPAAADATGSVDDSAVARATVARFALARDRLQDVVAWLRENGAGVPAWTTRTGNNAARTARATLRRHSDPCDLATFGLVAPDWRLAGDGAAVDARYLVRSRAGAPAWGRLRLEMVWRGGAWRVTSMALEAPH